MHLTDLHCFIITESVYVNDILNNCGKQRRFELAKCQLETFYRVTWMFVESVFALGNETLIRRTAGLQIEIFFSY